MIGGIDELGDGDPGRGRALSKCVHEGGRGRDGWMGRDGVYGD